MCRVSPTPQPADRTPAGGKRISSIAENRWGVKRLAARVVQDIPVHAVALMQQEGRESGTGTGGWLLPPDRRMHKEGSG